MHTPVTIRYKCSACHKVSEESIAVFYQDQRDGCLRCGGRVKRIVKVRPNGGFPPGCVMHDCHECRGGVCGRVG